MSDEAKMPNADRLAFPVEYSPTAAYLRGLSKREYLAGQALAGLLASPATDQFFAGGELEGKLRCLAHSAVLIADTLLAELGEPIP